MTVEELRNTISNTKMVVLYFKNKQCPPCQVLRPKVETLIKDEFPSMTFQVVDAVENPLLASAYHVFSNPTILVFFEGKEYIRKSKYIAISELEQEINRLYQLMD